MFKNKKLMMVGICSTVIACTIGIGLNSSSQADGIDKKEKLENLKKEEQRLKAKLEEKKSISAETTQEKAEREKAETQIKKIGIEAGTLQDELYPPDPKVKLAENIKSLKNILEINGYYETKTNDPIYGEAYKKAAQILKEKKEKLAEIERDFIEGNKSVEVLTKEFEVLRAIRELNINE
ncbi:hypothetical protein [Paenibacillus chitinolyticus]|uniref:hypothetical protein n=1 Tax=Paenibacillus chitinolyticus TaxID=79263 RepID=UPI001C45C68D|nr:hypothetical protein [Paenibacillus chitinolyticus]MBV6716854.1 hypothetical protein [Paenibacillus chitinolyticus]